MLPRLKSIDRGATRGKHKRTPGGSQCRYCLARGTDSCPESSKLVYNLPATLNTDMTPAQASRVLTACAVAKKIVKDTEAHAKSILKADIEGIPDWTLKDTGKTRTVTGIWAAFAELKEIGISEQEFLQTLSFSFKKMSDLLYEKHPEMTKGECKDMVEATLAEVTETTPKQRSLKYVGTGSTP